MVIYLSYSDAGTPSISDPGAILDNECIKNNINVIPIPGPSSVIISCFNKWIFRKIFFLWFFSRKKKNLEMI